MLLKELCEIDGVSGNEGAVRKYILGKIEPYADEIQTDSMGNIIAKKCGVSSEHKVMLSAHMDEVGFIISGITDKGFLEFKTVGGIDTRVIISKKVRIGKDKIGGVIGMKAIHLQTPDERMSVPKVSSLFIDIGAHDKAEAESKIELGDYAAFDTDFAEIGTGKYKAKAIDDRAGCAVLAELIKEKPMFDTYFCFTTQEEVGLRGARIAANRIMPDIALVVEATTCSDVGGVRREDYVTSLGEGAAISFADRTTIVKRDFALWLHDLAKREEIKVQNKSAVAGGNDAGAIHLCGGGIKTASVSVPCRYLHSPAGIADASDIESTFKLVRAFLMHAGEII